MANQKVVMLQPPISYILSLEVNISREFLIFNKQVESIELRHEKHSGDLSERPQSFFAP